MTNMVLKTRIGISKHQGKWADKHMLQFSWFPKTGLANSKSTFRCNENKVERKAQSRQPSSPLITQAVRRDLLLLNGWELSLDTFTTKLLCPVQSSVMENQPLIEKSVDLGDKIVCPLQKQDGSRKAEHFWATSPPLPPQPTCGTSLDGLQFASLPAPPYVSGKREIRKFPVTPYSASPSMHMGWGRTEPKDSIHDPTPVNTKGYNQYGSEYEWRSWFMQEYPVSTYVSR